MTQSSSYDKNYYESPEEKELDSISYLKDLYLLMELLNPCPDEKILDLGCGLGRFDGIIAQRGAEVTAIDISEYAIEKAKEKYKNQQSIKFICMNAIDMNYDKYFDKILCYQVIEHLSSKDGHVLLGKINRALKDCGVVVIGVPINDFTITRRMLRIMAHKQQCGRKSHLVSFTLKQIKNVITSSGFTVTDIHALSYLAFRLPEWICQIPFINQAILCADIRAVKKPNFE